MSQANNNILKSRLSAGGTAAQLMISLTVFIVLSYFYFQLSNFFFANRDSYLRTFYFIIGFIFFFGINVKYLSSHTDTEDASITTSFVIILFTVTALFTIVKFFGMRYLVFLFPVKSMTTVLVIVTIIVSFVLFFAVFGDTIDYDMKQPTEFGFLMTLLFYIPKCCMYDMVLSVTSEFANAAAQTKILLAAEIVFIFFAVFGYGYLSNVATTAVSMTGITSSNNQNKVSLLGNGNIVLLDKYRIIAKNKSYVDPSEQQNDQSSTISNSNGKKNFVVIDKTSTSLPIKPLFVSTATSLLSSYSSSSTVDGQTQPQPNDYGLVKNFSIELWLYPNEIANKRSSEQSQFVEVFRYGNESATITSSFSSNSSTENSTENQTVHPKLSVNVDTKELRVHYMRNNSNIDLYFDFRLSPRKWHYLVFTYANNIFDFFADGVLLQSIPLFKDANTIPVISSDDIVSLCINTTNQYEYEYEYLARWGVRDMYFWYQPLTAFQIANNYNMNQTILD